MARRPIFSRLIVTFAGMIALVVAIGGAVVYVAGQRAARAQQIDELSRLTKLVREQLAGDARRAADGAGGLELSDARRGAIRGLAELLATRITLIDAAGRVVFDTQADASTMENHNQRPEIVDARRRGAGSTVRFSDTIHEEAVYVAAPLDPADADGTILRLSYPRHVWTTLAVPAWAIVLAAALSAVLLMGWLTLLLHRGWIGPVRALSSAAARMGSGRWDTRVQPRGAEEISRFSETLNQLAEQAERQLADLAARQSELRALVDSLPDPILLTDAQQRVALINAPAARLLQLAPQRALGQKLIGVLSDEALVSMFEAAVNAGAAAGAAPQLRDVRIMRNGQRSYYQAVATRTRGGGVLLVLRNVTTMASAVQMKTDFVANASHELRTPIAAIKVAFETLQEVLSDDPRQTAKCLAIVAGHIGRLEEMLSDLLDLSRVESPDLKPYLSPVRVEEVFAMVRGTVGTVAQQKGVELAFERGAAAPVAFHSDKRLLNLILRNLVENSVKFTPTGGKVTVSVGAAGRDGADDDVVLRVSDTGIGIPPEHQERVFERFYQVDTARSSAAGRGTGLGLAIVKHAVHALGGTVALESAVGAGTTVTCTLPRNEARRAADAAADEAAATAERAVASSRD